MEGEMNFQNIDKFGGKKQVMSDVKLEFSLLNLFCRYTCLVCSYRPVFDTVDMLTVHRKGKKHLEGKTCLCLGSDFKSIV